VRTARALTSLRAELVAALRTRPARARRGAGNKGLQRSPPRQAAESSELWDVQALASSVRELVAFERAVRDELSARPHLAPGSLEPLEHLGQLSSCQWSLNAVHQLVADEQRLFASAATLGAARANMAAAPTQLLHRAVSLFQQLFGVADLADLFERIWAVHLAHADAQHLHRAVCAALGVPAETPHEAVLAHLREIEPAA
jgi:hypothetical protein